MHGYLESVAGKKIIQTNVLNSTALDFIFQMAGELEPFTATEEREYLSGHRYPLCKKMQEELVLRNLRFAIHEARRWVGHGVGLDDLVSSAVVGLVVAGNRFVPELGYRYITYATWWINRECSLICHNSHQLRLPVNVWKMLTKVSKWKNTDEEMAVLDAEKRRDAVRAIEQASYRFVSIDEPLKNQESPYDTLCDLDQPDPLELAEGRDVRRKIDEALGRLTDREAYVVRTLFGLDTDEESTLESIGVDLGVTKERVRQIKEKAFWRLRRNRGLREVYND